MRPSRVALIALILGLSAVGMVGVFGIDGRAVQRESASVETVIITAPTTHRAAEAHVPVAVERLRRIESRMTPARVTSRLSDDDAALVAEVGALQLLAQGTGLELESAQWSALAAATLDTQAVRQAFEAEIATTTQLGPQRYRMEIPGYAAAGAALRAKFYARLGAELGEGIAADIADKFGSALEGYLGAFGVSLQTLEIVGDPRAGMADVEVTRTVTYWSRTEAGERVVTRRETHLPAWEDPEGLKWGAMLAVAAGASAKVKAEG